MIVATAGARGVDELAASGLSVPVDEIYNDPRVRRVALASELSSGGERGRVMERYPPHVANDVVAHGIGEYLGGGT